MSIKEHKWCNLDWRVTWANDKGCYLESLRHWKKIVYFVHATSLNITCMVHYFLFNQKGQAKPMLFIILLYTMFHLTLSHELLYICTVEFATAGMACPVCCSDFSCIFQPTENNVPWMWCLGKLYGQSKQFSLFVSDSLDPAFVISPYDSSVQVASFCALLWTLILLKRLSE